MATEYTLHLTIDGDTRTLTIAGDTPGQLAQAIHRHARGQLGGRRIDVRLDGESGEVVSHHAVVGHFTLEPVDQPDTSTDATEEGIGIRWGYTLHDLQHLARKAALNARFFSSASWHDYYEEALSTIYTRLTAADTKPHRNELLYAADRAITDFVRGQRLLRGWREAGDNYGIKWNPQFFRYWYTGPELDLAERTAERIAVHQILAALWPAERAVVEALAACGHYDTAAESLGITPQAFHRRLAAARRRFLRLWYYPEEPGQQWRQDRRRPTNPPKDVCGNGHEYTPENSGMRTSASRRGERYCKACSRESNARSYARRTGKAVTA